MAGISSDSTFQTCCHCEDAAGDRCAGENSDVIIKSSSLVLWLGKLEEEMVHFSAEGHTAGQNQSQELKKWLWHVISDLGIHTYFNHKLRELEVILKVTDPKLSFNAEGLWNPRQTLVRP